MYARVCTRCNIDFMVVTCRGVQYPKRESNNSFCFFYYTRTCFTTATHAIWLRNLMMKLHIMNSIARPLRIFFMITMLQCFIQKIIQASNGSKYLKLKYLIVRDLVKDGIVVVKYVDMDFMLADTLTKRLKHLIFQKTC
ncbi:hypothetical protein CR513_55067, partial [Mucuna pruriens]